jgi:hypothetical protein
MVSTKASDGVIFCTPVTAARVAGFLLTVLSPALSIPGDLLANGTPGSEFVASWLAGL